MKKDKDINALIKEHLNSFNYDIRKHKNARFMDQKVTPDVLCIVADCVLQFAEEDADRKFTSKDIWKSEYAEQHVRSIFKKPSVTNKKATREYNKFFHQPLKMLAYAKILNEIRKGERIHFQIKNLKLLKYISFKERNALNFIVLYLNKVFSDSNFLNKFKKFLDHSTRDNFDALKQSYEEFIIDNTPINGKLEVRRIFTKIINPMAYKRSTHGTKRGSFSKDVIGYAELMYNRENWRDIKKRRGETRKGYSERVGKMKIIQTPYNKYKIAKAKEQIKKRHGVISEVKDEWANSEATQVHHIFPESRYPEIASHLENLILLTPTQHLGKAHPDNNTKKIDKAYQKKCLLSKSSSIQESVEEQNDGFYSKEDFIFVLNEGIDPEEKFVLEKEFKEINEKIKGNYK